MAVLCRWNDVCLLRNKRQLVQRTTIILTVLAQQGYVSSLPLEKRTLPSLPKWQMLLNNIHLHSAQIIYIKLKHENHHIKNKTLCLQPSSISYYAKCRGSFAMYTKKISKLIKVPYIQFHFCSIPILEKNQLVILGMSSNKLVVSCQIWTICLLPKKHGQHFYRLHSLMWTSRSQQEELCPHQPHFCWWVF